MSPITNWESLAQSAKASNTGFEPAPDGNYNMTITEVKLAKSGNGNKKFSTTLVIDSGPYKNKKLWHDFVVAEKSLRIFFENMAVFGMPYEFFNAQTQDEQVVANLLGKRFSADLITDEWEGKKKNKIGAGWTIKEPTALSELVAGNGVPGASSPVSSTAPPQPTYQSVPPQAQPPVQQQVADVDPWQAPPAVQAPPAQQFAPQQTQAAPPPPPPGAGNWGAPPPPPPGL